MQHRFNAMLHLHPNCEISISPLLTFSPFPLITTHAVVDPHNPQLLQLSARDRPSHHRRSPRARLQPDHRPRYGNGCYVHPAARLLHQQQFRKLTLFFGAHEWRRVVLIILLCNIERGNQPWLLSHQPQLVNRWKVDEVKFVTAALEMSSYQSWFE